MSGRVFGPVSAPVGNIEFVATTALTFFQAAAPLRWTQDTSNTDAMLRVVSGSGGGTGGSDSATTGLTVTDSTTLTVAQMPAHTHDVEKIASSGGALTRLTTATNVTTVDTTGTEDAAVTKGGGTGHTHPITHAPKFLDMIVCTFDG